jgi:8-oxo-dGTP diphosphatase
LKALFYNLSAGLWRMVKGTFQWYVVWFFNAKFMISVAGVVVRADGRVLLLRHRYWMTGTWGLPGGIMKSGETIEQALRREVKEETGYEVEPLRTLQIRSGYKLRMEVFMFARLTGGTERLEEHEVLEAQFFACDALPDGVLDIHRHIIDSAMQQELSRPGAGR